DMIRETTREIIEMSGYKVLEARHGGEALSICERYEDPIDLVITDVVMPQMSGPELAERLVGLRPETRVIYMSGYTENAIVHHNGLNRKVSFLQKPFTQDALAHMIRKVLDTPRRRSAQAS
nr:response regulator [Pyrinomonadaceae bacterium]